MKKIARLNQLSGLTRLGLFIAVLMLSAAPFYLTRPATQSIRENLLAGNYQSAYSQARLAAQQGEPSSQNTLGNLYYLGLGTKKNYRAAARWYVKAALQNYGPAQANLGHLYSQGFGVPKNVVRTLGWYLLAQKSGYKNIEILLQRTTHENHFNPHMIQLAKALFQSLDNVKKHLAEELTAMEQEVININ